MRMRIGIVFLALVFSAVASAQDFASEKKKLLADFRELPKLAEAVRYNKAEYDSLDALNARLKKRLLAITSKYPNSIKDDFREFDDAPLAIHTSPDGKFRIYTWDDETGGTMRGYINIYQFKGISAVGSRLVLPEAETDDTDGACLEVHEVVSSGKPYYVVFSIFVASSAGFVPKAKIFSIDGNALNDKAKLIRTQTGLKNELWYELDFTAKGNRDYDFRHLHDTYFKYDRKTKTISFPLVQDDYKVTKKKIRYRFNGKCFEKIGNDTQD